MKCCGQERTTRFCPECGTRVQETHDLYGLLGYCRGKASGANKSAETNRMQGGYGAPDIEYQERQERIAKKWTTWADELERLMNQAKGDGTPDT